MVDEQSARDITFDQLVRAWEKHEMRREKESFQESDCAMYAI